MTESRQASLTEPSAVRITRLKEGYSWNVVVSADDNSEDALQEAKERALVIVRELEQELARPQVEEEVRAQVEDEVPF
jgi:hypothetical protein